MELSRRALACLRTSLETTALFVDPTPNFLVDVVLGPEMKG
jgi:hypothetical protein